MDNLSAYLQVYKNERAVYECLDSFRKFHPAVPILLYSGGSDFSWTRQVFGNIEYFHGRNIMPSGKFEFLTDAYEYFKRIDECSTIFQREWIVLLEEDVIAHSTITHFPETSLAGAKGWRYSEEFEKKFNTNNDHYGLCGASIFKRESFKICYNKLREGDVELWNSLDERIGVWSDATLGAIFAVNGFRHAEWHEQRDRNFGAKEGALEHPNKNYYNMSLTEYQKEKINGIVV